MQKESTGGEVGVSFFLDAPLVIHVFDYSKRAGATPSPSSGVLQPAALTRAQARLRGCPAPSGLHAPAPAARGLDRDWVSASGASSRADPVSSAVSTSPRADVTNSSTKMPLERAMPQCQWGAVESRPARRGCALGGSQTAGVGLTTATPHACTSLRVRSSGASGRPGRFQLRHR
uniref:Uncharacterized protein n=1 Tax=uncultured prokaryote TaxID=198431 RepID=A0A0H5Q3W1_9ZZZZ|nr:hypothetical protein [uncultured prokaryote]